MRRLQRNRTLQCLALDSRGLLESPLPVGRNYVTMSISTVQRSALSPMLTSLPALQRISTAAGARSLSSASSVPLEPGFIEVREYTLKPEGFRDYISMSERNAPVRKSLLPFLGMFTCDIGGALNKVSHFYCYKDYDSRDATRQAAAKNPEWVQFVNESRLKVAHQENKVMQEALAVYEACGITPAATYKSPPKAGDKAAVYEIRNYQLHPGYGSVPKLLDAFTKGLPHKIKVDEEGSLVLFAYSDVGLLNNVMELWRYPSAQACIRARQSARKVTEWRDAIAQVTPHVQTFQTSFLNPTSFSPWQ